MLNGEATGAARSWESAVIKLTPSSVEPLFVDKNGSGTGEWLSWAIVQGVKQIWKRRGLTVHAESSKKLSDQRRSQESRD